MNISNQFYEYPRIVYLGVWVFVFLLTLAATCCVEGL